MNNKRLTILPLGKWRRRLLLSVFTGASFLTGCSSAPDKFGKLDLKKWRGDRGGCNGIRATLLPNFRAEIQNLKGNSSNTIGELLGRPDVNQIADRNQKYYIYFFGERPTVRPGWRQINQCFSSYSYERCRTSDGSYISEWPSLNVSTGF